MKSDGGEGGIRTREKRKPLRDFQSRPFVHSGTSPRKNGNRYYKLTPPRPQAPFPSKLGIPARSAAR